MSEPDGGPPPIEYPAWLLEAAEKWRARLAPAWRLMFEWEAPPTNRDGEATSNTNVAYHHLRLWINVNHSSLENLEEHQRRRQLEETLVHEILHAVLGPVLEAYEPALNSVGDGTRDVLETRMHHAVEQAVEGLSRSLVALEHGDRMDMIRVRPLAP